MKKIRILSIDGGGIKGIIPAQIISYIEKQIQEYCQDSTLKISDFFDVITGTSTGGILTALYLVPDKNKKGRSQYFAQEAVEIYKENGVKIFDLPLFYKIKTLNGMIDKKYIEEPFQEILDRYFGESNLSELSRLGIFCAYDISLRKSRIFNSFKAQKQDSKNFLLKDVIRATTAAPAFFSPASIYSHSGEKHCLIDGFVTATNPTMVAYSQAKNIDFKVALNNMEKVSFPQAKDMIIVSLGTGFEKESFSCNEMSSKGIIGWLKPIIDICMSGNTEIAHYHLKNIFSSIEPEHDNYYFRLEPGLGDASPELDDASSKNLKKLLKAGDNYVKNNQKFINNIVKLLVQEG